jgi:exodeoxyribonuclease VII large subunit
MHLIHNEWRLGFDVNVFAATVQGKEAPKSLMEALGRAQAWEPDVVVVVRGGGSALDLDAFNDLDLCLAFSQSLHPVLTGIGHETDLSVADLVAHQHFKTPTAVADFLVDRMVGEQSQLAEWSLAMGARVHQRLASERERFARDLQILQLQPLQLLGAEGVKLTHARAQLASMAQHALTQHMQRMKHLSQTVDALSPQKTLARGFSIARKAGEAIKNAGDLASGDELSLEFHQGRALVTVTNVTSGTDE